jgi:hypothetical protein
MNTSPGGEHISTFHAAPSGCALQIFNAIFAYDIRTHYNPPKGRKERERGKRDGKPGKSNACSPLELLFLPSSTSVQEADST